MEYFIISDIHGSEYYLKQAIELYKKSKASYIILLGDILNHGPRNPLPKGYNPEKCIEMLNFYKSEIIAIQGNCDSEVDESCLEFVLPRYNTFIHNGRKVFLHHGHTLDDYQALKSGDLIMQGHTHIPKAELNESIYYCNPGSLSIPKGGFPNSYAILNDSFTVYSLKGEVIKTIKIR